MTTVIDGSLGVTYPVTAGGTSAVQASSSKVLQVVNATTNTQVSTTSYQTPVSTSFSASITPSSVNSKILVLMSCGGTESNNSSGPQINYWLYRGASSVFRISNRAMYSSSGALGPVCNYLDSPATTSSVTYTIYFSTEVSGATVYFCTNSSGANITLLEIAA
jgi:hypothetical protein